MAKQQGKMEKTDSFSRSQPQQLVPNAVHKKDLNKHLGMNDIHKDSGMGVNGVNGYGPAATQGYGGRGLEDTQIALQQPVPLPEAPKKPKKKKGKVDDKKEGPTSLFILSETNIIRRLTKFLIEWPPFEYTVLLTIIANCVVLAVERPLPNGDKTMLAMELVSKV